MLKLIHYAYITWNFQAIIFLSLCNNYIAYNIMPGRAKNYTRSQIKSNRGQLSDQRCEKQPIIKIRKSFFDCSSFFYIPRVIRKKTRPGQSASSSKYLTRKKIGKLAKFFLVIKIPADQNFSYKRFDHENQSHDQNFPKLAVFHA